MALLTRTLPGLLCMVLLGGCVTLPPDAPRSPQDPYERWNRGVYRFNDSIDRAVLRPVARTYVRSTPQPVRTGIANFLANLQTPTVMINDALQGKPTAALADLGRFLLNTTAGLGGLLDPASMAGIPRNDEDFGQTLGKWGVHPGPFIELPLFGASDLRDAPARLVDVLTYPPTYAKDPWVSWGIWGVYIVDTRAGLLSLDTTVRQAFDPYVLIRDAYLQRRAYLISGGKPADDEPLVDPDADPAQPADTGAPPRR